MLKTAERFVESPWLERQPGYASFVNRSFGGRLVLLELGVGFNTPSIIRWSFEWIASRHPNATLVRINPDGAAVPSETEEKSIEFQEDAA
jgi:hypothetical protein